MKILSVLPRLDRRIWSIAVPLMAANLSVPLLGAVDTAVVGHLPDPHHLGGVAVGAMMFSVVYWGFGFLRTGTVGLTAQALGADDPAEAANILARALILALFFSVILWIVQKPIAWLFLVPVEETPKVQAAAAEYFFIRIWSAPAALINYAFLGWFLGMQRPGLAMVVHLTLNGLNVVLDVFFVMGLGMGVAGVAWATLVADYSAAGLGLLLVVRLVGTRPSWSAIWDRPRLIRLMVINGDIFVRNLCVTGGFAMFTITGAQFGAATLAANAVLMNFQQIMAYCLDGFADAGQTLVGRAVGAGDRDGLRRTILAVSRWALVFALMFSAIYGLAGDRLAGLLTDISSVRDVIGDYLPWVVVSPVISVASFVLDGVFLGATRSRAMRDAMILSVLFYGLALVVLVPIWGNHGLWASLLLFLAARGVFLGFYLPRLLTARAT